MGGEKLQAVLVWLQPVGNCVFWSIGCLTMHSFTPQPAGDVTAFVISVAITHMASVKALRATCTPLSSSSLSFPLSGSHPLPPPLSAVSSLTPAFHLSRPPSSPRTLALLFLFSCHFLSLTAHPPLPLLLSLSCSLSFFYYPSILSDYLSRQASFLDNFRPIFTGSSHNFLPF